MSVYDREPDVPRDDTGKGLRLIGWMLLIWTAFSMIWIPPRVMSSRIAVVAHSICLGAGSLLIGVGYVVSWLAPDESGLTENTHDLMEATHSGNQLEEPLFANQNGPGLEPKRIA
jgi:hypothetical protein